MQYTSNLNLKKPDSTDYVNVSDLNDNMDIIDQTITEISDSSSGIEQQLAEHLDDDVKHITAQERTKWDGKLDANDLKEASTSQKGIVQLSTSVSSPSITEAATPSSVKQAYDKAVLAEVSASVAAKIASGTYTGNNATSRNIIVGFAPKFLAVSSLGDTDINTAQIGLTLYDSTSAKIIDNAINVNTLNVVHGSFSSVNLGDNGFTVVANPPNIGLNLSGKSYGWVAIG